MRNPDTMIIVPNVKLAAAIVIDLLTERETFGVEPSVTQDGVWHIWVTPTGQERAVDLVRTMGY